MDEGYIWVLSMIPANKKQMQIPWNSPNGKMDEDTFEFYQWYKQTESKIQVAEDFKQ